MKDLFTNRKIEKRTLNKRRTKCASREKEMAVGNYF